MMVQDAFFRCPVIFCVQRNKANQLQHLETKRISRQNKIFYRLKRKCKTSFLIKLSQVPEMRLNLRLNVNSRNGFPIKSNLDYRIGCQIRDRGTFLIHALCNDSGGRYGIGL